jgi:hypothetical protein
MLSLVETSKQRAPRVAAGSAAEALRPATPPENRQRRRSISGLLATSIIHNLRNPLASFYRETWKLLLRDDLTAFFC